MPKVLDIVIYPDPRLKQASQPVAAVDDTVRRHFDDLMATVKKHDGVGLAGVQVGIMKRLFVVDLEVVAERDGREILNKYEHQNGTLCLANAEITYKSEEMYTLAQSCISLPGSRVEVTRPKKIKIKFLDYNNKQQEIEADSLFSQCLQHENDHTNGILITDYLSPLKREMQLKKVIRSAKHASEEM